jgi:hypothetical protein
MNKYQNTRPDPIAVIKKKRKTEIPPEIAARVLFLRVSQVHGVRSLILT